MKQLILKTVAVLLIAGSSYGLDLVTGRALGQGGTVSLHRSSATELLSVPSGSLDTSSWLFETGYTRQFELSDFDQIHIASAYRKGKVTFALGLTQFGKVDLYREQSGKLLVAYAHDSLSFGLTISGMQIDFGGNYGRLRTQTIGLGSSYRSDRWMFGVAVDNLTKPKLHPDAVPFNRIFSAHAEVVGNSGFSFTGRLTLEDTEKPRLGLGQCIPLAERSNFFWGISTEPMRYGAGVELFVGSSAITYAADYHPVLGFSFAISVSTGTFFAPKKTKGEFD